MHILIIVIIIIIIIIIVIIIIIITVIIIICPDTTVALAYMLVLILILDLVNNVLCYSHHDLILANTVLDLAHSIWVAPFAKSAFSVFIVTLI